MSVALNSKVQYFRTSLYVLLNNRWNESSTNDRRVPVAADVHRCIQRHWKRSLRNRQFRGNLANSNWRQQNRHTQVSTSEKNHLNSPTRFWSISASILIQPCATLGWVWFWEEASLSSHCMRSIKSRSNVIWLSRTWNVPKWLCGGTGLFYLPLVYVHHLLDCRFTPNTITVIRCLPSTLTV